MLKEIKILALLCLILSIYVLITTPFQEGEALTFTPLVILWSLFVYSIWFTLALFIIRFFRKVVKISGLSEITIGFRLLIVLAGITGAFYGYAIIQLLFSVGETYTYTTGNTVFTMVVTALVFILSILTIIYFKKFDKLQIINDAKK